LVQGKSQNNRRKDLEHGQADRVSPRQVRRACGDRPEPADRADSRGLRGARRPEHRPLHDGGGPADRREARARRVRVRQGPRRRHVHRGGGRAVALRHSGHPEQPRAREHRQGPEGAVRARGQERARVQQAHGRDRLLPLLEPDGGADRPHDAGPGLHRGGVPAQAPWLRGSRGKEQLPVVPAIRNRQDGHGRAGRLEHEQRATRRLGDHVATAADPEQPRGALLDARRRSAVQRHAQPVEHRKQSDHERRARGRCQQHRLPLLREPRGRDHRGGRRGQDAGTRDLAGSDG